MRHSFYDSEEYRQKQSEITKRNQERGAYAHLRKRVRRSCGRDGCQNTFVVQEADPRKYCGRGCAASVRNMGRAHSDTAREKIARANRGRPSPFKDVIRVARLMALCSSPSCGKMYVYERYKKREFCSSLCAIRTIGSRPTSPKASRGKAGIRPDVSPDTYFFSRWEANMARLYTYLGVPWEFEPRAFDIGNQSYTPDFYLPGEDTYVEVKNFWGAYSRERDTKFRNRHPELKLKVILKAEYRELEERYAHLIPGWEYKDTPFP